MPYALIILGVVLFIAASRGTVPDLAKTLQVDLLGPGGFIWWIVVILIIGAVGYVKELRPVTNAFLVLLIVVLFLKNGGVFTNAVNALKKVQATYGTSPIAGS